MRVRRCGIKRRDKSTLASQRKRENGECLWYGDTPGCWENLEAIGTKRSWVTPKREEWLNHSGDNLIVRVNQQATRASGPARLDGR